MVYRPTQTTSKPPRPPKGGSSADKESRTMTREEAMEALSVLKIYDAQWLREAVDIAIEALEQEETLQNLTKPYKSDLIVKGAGEIKDGLYNIKDGKLFKYKANGGTVRTYPIVSADRPTLTPEEFAEKMAGIAKNGDEERKHVEADGIMCELLKSLGFGEGVGIFEDMDKWYS